MTAIAVLEPAVVQVGAHEVIRLPVVLAGPEERVPGGDLITRRVGGPGGASRAGRGPRPRVIPGLAGQLAHLTRRGHGLTKIRGRHGRRGERPDQLAVVGRIAEKHPGRVGHDSPPRVMARRRIVRSVSVHAVVVSR